MKVSTHLVQSSLRVIIFILGKWVHHPNGQLLWKKLTVFCTGVLTLYAGGLTFGVKKWTFHGNVDSYSFHIIYCV